MGKPAYIEDEKQWAEEFTFFDEISVRFSETDAFGHVNNTVAFIYFEQARIRFFQHGGLMDEWVNGPYMIVTGDLQCDYIRQITFGETLRVGVKAAKIGRTSVDIHYMVLNEKDELCMTGRGRIVQVDKTTGKPAAWENHLLEKMEV
ncbi:acyl-CoA thioesterase [Bacillus daqingensis]|uniref:Acyl-CoA thioesterase n=1 Tax=Bacillus daqingensis TaxID=872396 RepID=A0ABV9NZE3_9BACI